jgi:hypothetical protein
LRLLGRALTTGMAIGPEVSIDERVDVLRTTGMGFRHLAITAAYLGRLWPAGWTSRAPGEPVV